MKKGAIAVANGIHIMVGRLVEGSGYVADEAKKTLAELKLERLYKVIEHQKTNCSN